MRTPLPYLNIKIDNSGFINRAIDAASDGDTIVLPPGRFPIHTPIQIIGKTVHLEGDNTSILTGLDSMALIVRGPASKPIKISNIDFINAYGFSTLDGVLISAIVHMNDCWIKSFGGNGLVVSADLRTTKTNCSFSRFDNLLISGNKKSGMFFQGGDANQCNSYHIDVRDNGEYGIWDHSFLGNQFFGCMAHNNKLGNYCADDPNNRAAFFGCYSEQGSPPETLAGAATWHGGLAANKFQLKAWAKVYMDTTYK